MQALIRGHLVRRQAAATLRAMRAIVKFQALARGRSVRRSSVALDVATKFRQQKVWQLYMSVESPVVHSMNLLSFFFGLIFKIM